MITLEESYRQCMVLTRSHYENFPVASVLLPAQTRPAIAVIYAFARCADDFGDEEPDTVRSLELLAGWRDLLHASVKGPVDHFVFRALRDVIERFEIPVQWLDNLIMAFERDRTIVRHPTFSDLMTYSRLSANPVGRLLLWIHGYRDEELLTMSDAICSALQLANFWQDIGLDREKGRIYVPLSELSDCGLDESSLYEGLDARHEKLKKHLRSYTMGLFMAGRELPSRLSGRLSLEIALVLAGGVRILEAGTRPGRSLLHRPVLRKTDWALDIVRVVSGTWRFPQQDSEDGIFQEGFRVFLPVGGQDLSKKTSSMIRS
ncbi:squalene/phytoene synthase family protein [Leptospirillum ferriphilum]|uniref:Phytoene synthase n=2 Tax=Leptospirillum TaxID=179 RepID=A0A094W9G0_9BACT|nr:squalene/phytoene synthase family protein [Leptospirillum ferriphilum]EDZ40265.1 MAG: Putative phytoene synthase [Leptospirillum sp. Group II '5-way CG']KGA94158.1 Phytoene synthase [Leptospirillum ferriphilum]